VDEVRRLRLEKGWSQNELAYHAKLAPSVISLIETGKREPNATTLRKLSEALEVRIPDLFEESGSGKARRRSSLEPSLFNGNEDERRLRYLRGWRAFVHGLARRWERDPPKTSAEISPLFDAMTALVEQGVFEPSEASASEGHELMLLTVGFQRLNDIADTVEKDEEAEQRRDTFRLIQEKRGA